MRLKVTSNGGLNNDNALNHPGTFTTLMTTCKTLHEITKKIRDRWRLRTPLVLHYMQSNEIRNFTGLHFRMPPSTWAGTVREPIDVSNDLIVVCRLPVSATQTYPTVESIGALYEFGHSSISPSSPFIPDWFIYPLGNLPGLLRLFPRLRVLYIIVRPEDIDEDIDPPENGNMTNYHSDYTQTVNQVPPKIFNARQRIYREDPKMRCRGLEYRYEQVKNDSITIRAGSGLPPLVIRVMTWKDAPEVRGRFDMD
ncbi:hypothetical protein FANTH_1489 [Fusarium anthophilum]|uniref:Uncharacterized protein n=1 Tax=Fusarium anthophilum TaxID=48485 RepID=A0A8H4ZW28_9HYPO|nr:hypothetical protein FANTH_1489 [Fusarium anthophilum]